jgi:hypothetical protein
MPRTKFTSFTVRTDLLQGIGWTGIVGVSALSADLSGSPRGAWLGGSL